MPRQKRQFSAKFKFQVALEASKNNRPLNEIASEHGIHHNVIGQWKKQLLVKGEEIFDHAPERVKKEHETKETELYEQIGRLKMELEWLKKKSGQVTG